MDVLKFISSFFYCLLSTEGLRPINLGGGLIISSSFLLFDDNVRFTYSGIVSEGEFPPKFGGGLILPWLSFFFSGGFIFLVEVNIGDSSTVYTLFKFTVVTAGLLKLLLNPTSSEMISSDWSPLNVLFLPKVF